MKNPITRVGLFGIGLDTYWPQFPGLKERLEGYIAMVEGRLARPDIEVVNLGLIDSPEKAFDAGHAFRRARRAVRKPLACHLRAVTHAVESRVINRSLG